VRLTSWNVNDRTGAALEHQLVTVREWRAAVVALKEIRVASLCQ
jgi:hypothetical protein